MFFNQTVHKDGSFVKMSSEDVKAKCIDTIRAIKATRLERISQTMEEARQKIMSGYFHRLFKKPTPTDEEVKAYLDDGFISELFWDETYGFKNEEVASKLLHACQFVEEIYVSTEDLRRIT
jgi:hypothetical protein